MDADEPTLSTVDDGPRRYASASIQERRRRIVDAARALIIAKGPDGFTMSEVAARADVALKTIYNSVSGKGDLIAQAVGEYQQATTAAIRLPEDHDFDDIVRSLGSVCARLIEQRGWGRAIVALYFDPDCNAQVHAKLREVAQTHLVPSLAWLRREGLARAGAPIPLIERQFAGTAYAVLADWAAGRIADDRLHPALAFALTMALLPAAKASAWTTLNGYTARFAAQAGSDDASMSDSGIDTVA